MTLAGILTMACSIAAVWLLLIVCMVRIMRNNRD